MEAFQEYWLLWLISNIVGVALLIVALWRSRLARLLFFLLFAWACWINYTTCHNDPEGYLDYAAMTPFPFLQDFINDWFKMNVTNMVTLIAIGQGLIALGMLLKGWFVRVACLGGIIFLVAIIPLGVGSGFPFSITASIALYFILKRDGLKYLWIS